MDGRGGCSSKTITFVHKTFLFLQWPSLVPLLFHSLSFVISWKWEQSVSAAWESAKNIHEVLYFCCCIKHIMKKQPRKCSLRFLTTYTPILEQVLKDSYMYVKYTKQTVPTCSGSNVFLGRHKLNCILRNVLKFLWGLIYYFVFREKQVLSELEIDFQPWTQQNFTEILELLVIANTEY